MTDIISIRLDEQDRKAELADRANLVATMSAEEFDVWMAAQETSTGIAGRLAWLYAERE